MRILKVILENEAILKKCVFFLEDFYFWLKGNRKIPTSSCMLSVNKPYPGINKS